MVDLSKAFRYISFMDDQARIRLRVLEDRQFPDRVLGDEEDLLKEPWGALVPEADLSGQYALLMARSRAYHRFELGELQPVADLAALQRLAEALAAPHRQAEVMRLWAGQAFAAYGYRQVVFCSEVVARICYV